VMGTFVLLGLGVIGEYLARIHEEVRGRPRYLVQEKSARAVAEAPDQLAEVPGQVAEVPEQLVADRK
jgi:hypothetical protein